mmetsp:Transcript_4643/g.9314  ORF Transcript_4643/g.9314 Transcript_4643/m.9314 type:complete len:82 (+) Transcript_4643:2173-2418(+)
MILAYCEKYLPGWEWASSPGERRDQSPGGSYPEVCPRHEGNPVLIDSESRDIARANPPLEILLDQPNGALDLAMGIPTLPE